MGAERDDRRGHPLKRTRKVSNYRGSVQPSPGPRQIYLRACLDDYRASPSMAGLPHHSGLISDFCSSGPSFPQRSCTSWLHDMPGAPRVSAPLCERRADSYTPCGLEARHGMHRQTSVGRQGPSDKRTSIGEERFSHIVAGGIDIVAGHLFLFVGDLAQVLQPVGDRIG